MCVRSPFLVITFLLTDTCLDGQDTFIKLLDMLEISH